MGLWDHKRSVMVEGTGQGDWGTDQGAPEKKSSQE